MDFCVQTNKKRLKDSYVASNYNMFLQVKIEIERLKIFDASRIKMFLEKRTLIKGIEIVR